ncbi:hypothetical protein I3U44_17150 [Mycobacteroides abscessus subsp. bolletii]|uniref:hypothetical protein n=1 Tax=Mycobacteroides abscessus TaxID=36809 RepID=UPI0019D03ED4|nr:hypothetical protein [Mycobacteroides abscessus]QSM87556.1 hypothetical protein I3U44_17150 [Mycobacteroides abscessus subsp. bolletii]
MTDPAIDAAQRALDGMPMLGEASATQAALKGLVLDVGAAAAREMAKSVQELHKPFKAYPDNEIELIRRRLGRSQLAKLRTGKVELPPQIRCDHCYDEDGDPVPWPCETAKRVYPTEEL